MDKSDFTEFCNTWSLAQELSANGREYSRAGITELFEMLERFPLEAVKTALRRHRENSKFAPTLHDVLALLDTRAKHLSPDEAWSLAVRSFDEAATVVMTQEMLEARAVAWEIWNIGDEIGARMAFRSAYERLLANAPPPVWAVSLGHDPALREEAIVNAVVKGLLPQQTAQRYLHAPVKDAVGLPKLLEQAARHSGAAAEDYLAKWRSVRALLPEDEDAVRKREDERVAFEQRRQQELAKVEARLSTLDMNTESSKMPKL